MIFSTVAHLAGQHSLECHQQQHLLPGTGKHKHSQHCQVWLEGLAGSGVGRLSTLAALVQCLGLHFVHVLGSTLEYSEGSM